MFNKKLPIPYTKTNDSHQTVGEIHFEANKKFYKQTINRKQILRIEF